jgi:hypothetical protein
MDVRVGVPSIHHDASLLSFGASCLGCILYPFCFYHLPTLMKLHNPSILACIVNHGIIPMVLLYHPYFHQYLYNWYVYNIDSTISLSLCVQWVVRLSCVYQRWERNKCEPWNHFGLVFKPEGNKCPYCKCLACHESKVTYDCMMCIIQNSNIRYYMVYKMYFLPMLLYITIPK